MKWITLTLFLLPIVLIAEEVTETRLTSQEQQEIDQKLDNFYNRPGPQQMNQAISKYSVQESRKVTPESMLRQKQKNASLLMSEDKIKSGIEKFPQGQNLSALQKLAQGKATTKYQQFMCKQLYAKKMTKLNCEEFLKHGSQRPDGRATREGNDKIENLTATWMSAPIMNLVAIKSQGKTKIDIWSDDYWKLRYGATSYRYAHPQHGIDFNSYRKAVGAYAQPKEWLSLAPAAHKSELWSPAEKYDLTVGDERFTLTNKQKNQDANVGRDGDIENWMGICHGWAPAAFIFPAPKEAFSVRGPKGASVKWYPHDVMAMASLNWANGDSSTNFVGGRCNYKDTTTHPNGRLKQQECFDNNPSTFHLALGNLIGEIQKSFVMDKTFDYEVWNQPVHSYNFTYFNPINSSIRVPDLKGENAKKVVVDYRLANGTKNPAFVAKDRFQKPLTRGKRLANGYDDKEVQAVVGVIATVVYVVEASPQQGAPAPVQLTRTTYTYDLELVKQGSELVAVGGEWHDNAHPDFLWVPQLGSTAFQSRDTINITFDGSVEPGRVPNLTSTAQSASGSDYPLCKVLKALGIRSRPGTSTFDYQCRG